MIWSAGSSDPPQQVPLKFESCETAQVYTAKYGIPARVYTAPAKALKIQACTDNFK